LKMGHCVRTNINEDKPVGRWKSLGRILRQHLANYNPTDYSSDCSIVRANDANS
jgi:hypothetical protein